MPAPLGTAQEKPDSNKQGEEARDSSAEVERLVHERTAELQKEIDTLRRENAELKHVERDPGDAEDCARDRPELNLIYTSAPIGLCLLGTDTRYLRVNQRFAEMNGFSIKEHIGKRVRDLAPSLAEAVEELARKVVETDEPVLDIEIQGETPAQPGVTRYWKESWWPLKDDRGRVVAINIVAEEITERKRAEEALWESERKFSVVFEKAPYAIALARRADGMLVDVNELFTKTFGYTKQEALGKTSAELGINPDPKDRARILAEMQQHRSIHDLEISLFTKSGEERIFSDNLDAIVIGGDQYLLSTIQDITDRKRAEEALRESEAKFRTIVETAGEGIVIARPEGNYFYVNQRMADMLGYSIDEILGKSSLDFMFDCCRPQVLQARNDLHPGDVLHGEFKFRRKDGSAMWSLYNATPMFNDKGEHVANFAMHIDITERKRLQEELIMANAQLEDRVTERTAELMCANTRLRVEIEERGRMEEALRNTAEEVTMILNSIIEMFFRLDKDWRYTYFNEQARKQLIQLGKNPDEMIGKVLWEEFPNPPVEEDFRRAMRERVPIFHEFYYPPLGEWVENRLYPTEDGGLAVFQRYITERKRAEEALRESEEKLRTLFDSLPIGISVLDADRKIREVNPALGTILDLKQEDLLHGAYTGRHYLRSDGTESLWRGIPAFGHSKSKRQYMMLRSEW